MRKKSTILQLMLCTLMLAAPGWKAEAAADNAGEYQFSYRVEPGWKQNILITSDIVTITNPQPDEIAGKGMYPIESYLQGRGTPAWDQAAITRFAFSKQGFLLQLYNLTMPLPPVYQEGYRPEEMEKAIARTEPNSPQWRELQAVKANKQLQARIQALIDAGYVKPEEIDDGWATRAFVARVLYRMFHEALPYQGSISILDTPDAAVRWAVEKGLPGFEPDAAGRVYASALLSSPAGPHDTVDGKTFQALYDTIRYLFPSKRTETGWAYYALSFRQPPACSDCALLVNGKAIEAFLHDHPGAAQDPRFQTGWQATKAKLAAALAAELPKLLAERREDLKKPLLRDWQRDVLLHPDFQPAIADYRRTRSDAALTAVYQAIRQHYRLTVRQDSPLVVKSVLENSPQR
ncbi:hypothetical protein G3578_16820 [Brevibacillus sp. SYP-B805]|uniref:hypothetical protein n=1 Tax=Brevibacillus sp. SYP-B805 TaxID=1578199 RepID=UPI0013EA6B15|nr:hypothetical protein [Brevibacillus sp. SYP-B805]NGQ96830.1 hypothetical protein [Brevibacillus sp. SYP-B805]